MRRNNRILIIDDCKTDQLITQQLLTKQLNIAEIAIANNGKEGILWINNHENIALENLIILLDIRMPEMDGFEFLESYHFFDESIKNNIQIVMLSSTLDIEDIERAKNNTYVKTLLNKPLSITEFSKMMSIDSL